MRAEIERAQKTNEKATDAAKKEISKLTGLSEEEVKQVISLSGNLNYIHFFD